MKPQQLELTRLIGKKELTFGCHIYIPMPEWYEVFPTACRWEYIYISFNKTDGKHLHHFVKELYTRNTKDSHYSYEEKELIDIEFVNNKCEIIGHPATLSDLHRWMNKKFEEDQWQNWASDISYSDWWEDNELWTVIRYDTNKDLLDQSSETLNKIIELIKSNSYTKNDSLQES